MSGSYLVEVKPSVFSETALTPSDFDEVSNMSLAAESFDEGPYLEFSSRDDAQSWIDSFGPEIYGHRDGRLRIHSAHPTDESTVDGYLLFKPR